MNNKFLVITSDDFGMSYGVNQGIINAAQANFITSTNIMVPAPWFEHAIAHSADINIDFGVHLTLTNEWDFYKWRPVTKASSLIDENGYLKKNIQDLMESADTQDIIDECLAQVTLAQRRARCIDYIDVHMCIPTIVEGKLLNPDHELKLIDLIGQISDITGLAYPYRINNGKLRYFDSILSISGKSKQEVFEYIDNIKEGFHHLSCHCSIDNTEQKHFSERDSHAYPWAHDIRKADFDIISSEEFRNIIIKNNVQIIKPTQALAWNDKKSKTSVMNF